MPLKVNGTRYNAAAFVVEGELQGFASKKNLAKEGLHYEPRWFEPWPAGEKTEITVNGKSYPCGDLLFEVDGLKVGFEICEDAWVKDRSKAAIAKQQPDIVINPSASHFAFAKNHTRRQIVEEGAKLFNAIYIYANMCSNEAGRIIYDGSCFIAKPEGTIAKGKRFHMQDYSLCSAVVDIEGYSPNALNESQEPVSELKEETFYAQEEEFLLAETLGLWDYLRKSYSRGFILSLSGGVDSAVCATLIYLTLKRAERELGLDGVKKKLGYFKSLQNCDSVETMMPHFLLCAYQATANSGPVTQNAAESLAKAVHADYHFLDVQPVLEGYHQMIQGALERNLTWEEDDLALQNIQARVRAPGIWMFANVRGGLLVTTSNRSEAAVGYATMDGDTSGGICPLGGVDKTFLRHWLVVMEKEGVCGFEKMPVLKFVNEQKPTAELRPSGSEQTDESDLMPYEILDAIEKAAIRDKQSPLQIFELIQKEFELGKEKAGHYTIRFFQLWSRNQWKRERYAPAFHMDDENLDPKTWCRFPILSGGFADDLQEIKKKAGL